MLLTKLAKSKLLSPYSYYSKMVQNKAIIDYNLKGYVRADAIDDYLLSIMPLNSLKDNVLFNMVLDDLRIRMRGVDFI